MRVLMTGSREWTNEEQIRDAFRTWWRLSNPDNPTLICGGAKGADSLAEKVWRDAGLPVEVHPAAWDVHEGCWCKDHTRRCGFAGHRRNREMVESGADICFAFLVPGAGNRGTRNCMETAQKAGIEVVEVWQSDIF